MKGAGCGLRGPPASRPSQQRPEQPAPGPALTCQALLCARRPGEGRAGVPRLARTHRGLRQWRVLSVGGQESESRCGRAAPSAPGSPAAPGSAAPQHPAPLPCSRAICFACGRISPLLGHLPLDLGPPGHPRTLFPHLNPKFNSLSPNKATSTGPGVRTQKRAGQGSGHLEERALWGCCAADGVPCSLPGSGAHTAAAPAARCWGPRSRT